MTMMLNKQQVIDNIGPQTEELIQKLMLRVNSACSMGLIQSEEDALIYLSTLYTYHKQGI